MNQPVFEAFSNGKLKLPHTSVAFETVLWVKHPDFKGVELKHIVTAKDTGGQFSYHLVRIAPNQSIGSHVHPAQLETHEVIVGSGVCQNGSAALAYEPGTISIMAADVPHKVIARADGLCLFAKFLPALC